MKKKILYIVFLLTIFSYFCSFYLQFSISKMILGSFVFLFLPGYVFLEVLDIQLKDQRLFIFSIGISVVFLMVGGLGLDKALYGLGIERPLDSLFFPYVYLSFVVAFLFYLLHRDIPEEGEIDLEINWNSNEIFFLAISISLLIFTIYSSLYLRIHNSNNLLISSYVVTFLLFSVIVFNNKISQTKRPIYLVILSLCLIIPATLRYNYIIGVDVFRSYQLSQHINIRGHWSVITDRTYLMSALSVNFLPVLIERIIGLSIMTSFRYIIPIIFSLSSLSVYHIGSIFLDRNKAFIAALVYCSTPYYLRAVWSPRTVLAVFFISLIGLTLVENNKKSDGIFDIIVVVFFIGSIVSHYSTSYVFFISLTLFFFLKIFDDRISKPKIGELDLKIKYWQLIVFFSIMYVWYGFAATRVFRRFVTLPTEALIQFLTGARVESSAATGAGREIWSVPRYIEFFAAWSIMILVAVAGIYLLKRWITRDISDKNKTHLLFMAGGSVIFAFLLFPVVVGSYGWSRTRIYSMIFLSSGFVFGVFLLFKNKERFGKVVVLLIIGLYLFSYSGVSYHISGHEGGYILDTEGDFYLEQYISRSEVKSAEWLDEYREEDVNVYITDHGETRRLDIVFEPPDDEFQYNREMTYRIDNETEIENIQGYIYLNRANIEFDKRKENQITFPGNIGYVEFEQKDTLVNNSNYIYTNGHSSVLKK